MQWPCSSNHGPHYQTQLLLIVLKKSGFKNSFINTDEEVSTYIQSLPSDEELLHDFTIENTCSEDVEMIHNDRDETESTEKGQPSKKALFEVMDLIESLTLFQNDNIAMQMRKCTTQLNELIASSSRKK